jgi:DNA repair protein RadD
MEFTGRLDGEDREKAIAVIQKLLTLGDLRAIHEALDKQAKGRRSLQALILALESQPGKRGRPRVNMPEEELAQLLVDRLGVGLLEERVVREYLALRCSDMDRFDLHGYAGGGRPKGGKRQQAETIAKRKWHPGKSWPRMFVRTLGLPTVFAGLPGQPREPEQMEVMPFQEELKKQAEAVLDAGPEGNRAVLTLPTGAGKTRTAVETVLSWKLRRSSERTMILWIAQSDELCEQAVQSFAQVWTDLGHREEIRNPLSIARYWGNNKKIGEPDVVVASIQKLRQAVESAEGSESREVADEIRDNLGAVIVDEVHGINAPSYGTVLGHLGVDLSPEGKSDVPLLGLTATPFRSDIGESSRLSRIFRRNLLHAASLGEDRVGALRKRGILAEARHELLEHGSSEFDMTRRKDYVDYFEQFKEFHKGFLVEVADDEARNRALLDRLLEIPEDWPTLFFGCTVQHAQAISVLLRRRGRAAAVVTGETRSATRRALIEQFRDGRLSVLCNYGVLTTGFDAPKVKAVVVGRPTTSRVLYEQMIGRGMRGEKFGGTPSCLVIDIKDNIKFHGTLAYQHYGEYWASESVG